MRVLQASTRTLPGNPPALLAHAVGTSPHAGLYSVPHARRVVSPARLLTPTRSATRAIRGALPRSKVRPRANGVKRGSSPGLLDKHHVQRALLGALPVVTLLQALRPHARHATTLGALLVRLSKVAALCCLAHAAPQLSPLLCPCSALLVNIAAQATVFATTAAKTRTKTRQVR